MANFLFVLSRDDNQAATRCFQFAQIAYQKDYRVNLFFIDEHNNEYMKLKRLCFLSNILCDLTFDNRIIVHIFHFKLITYIDICRLRDILNMFKNNNFIIQ